MNKNLFVLTLLFPAAVTAQELSTDRPDQTEAPFVIPFGTIQIESGFSKRKEEEITKTELPSVLWRISLTERMELRIITTHSKLGKGSFSENGIEPAEAGFKLKICEEKGLRPHVGFIQHVALPKLASENFKATDYAANFRFAAQHTLNKKNKS